MTITIWEYNEKYNYIYLDTKSETLNALYSSRHILNMLLNNFEFLILNVHNIKQLVKYQITKYIISKQYRQTMGHEKGLSHGGKG